MKTPFKLGIVATLALAVVTVAVVKKRQDSAPREPAVMAVTTGGARLPKLVDLGADKCIPCKLMAPILEDLRKEYAGKLEVEFIDVWKNEEAGKHYGIETIPTQIFYDAGGKELFRHVGYFSKEDILAKWKELGVSVTAP